jgi:serine/threonine-protein kinase SRK2
MSKQSMLVCPVQLADFGFSKDPKQQSEAKTRVGTPAYLAPEVIAAQPGKSYDAQVRMQSCVCALPY